MTSYQHEHFQVFCYVVDNSFTTITQDWVTNLNTRIETFAFHMVGPSY
jgi:hypothetical protein